MSKDFIGYDGLVDRALRQVVREALQAINEQGVRGNHNLYITFLTTAPGVELPDFLRERFPEEMTIVLQHQFWNLAVEKERFGVTLSFNKAQAHLVIPYAALTRFADPGVKFGLQFTAGPAPKTKDKGRPEAAPKASPAAPGAGSEPQETAPSEAGASAEAAAEKVVRLDVFRKK
jgi:hypothetical protein